jgi:apolipoprotein N-acyltransferase
VSFLVALVGTTLAWALHPPLRPRRLAVGGAALLLSAAPALLPSWDPPAGTDTVMVAVVQGNVPGEGMDAFAERRVVLDNHVQATLDLAARVEAGEEERPDLVLWPENSTDIDPFRDPTVHADIQRAVDAVAVPVLVGAMVGGPGPIDVRNQGIVWLPESGPATSYSKKHPVPFGEYIPMRKVLAEYFERLDQIPRDMVPGTDPGAMDMGAATVGDVICFEVIYDDLIRDVVRGGADFLVVQTNNATYMGTGQVDQQFAIARLRALETRRYVAVAATNGISAFVDPDAAVVDRAPKRTQEVMVREVARLDEQTPAVRYGAWVEGGLSAAGALAVVAGGLAGVLAARRGRAEQEQA